MLKSEASLTGADSSQTPGESLGHRTFLALNLMQNRSPATTCEHINIIAVEIRWTSGIT